MDTPAVESPELTLEALFLESQALHRLVQNCYVILTNEHISEKTKAQTEVNLESYLTLQLEVTRNINALRQRLLLREAVS